MLNCMIHHHCTNCAVKYIFVYKVVDLSNMLSVHVKQQEYKVANERAQKRCGGNKDMHLLKERTNILAAVGKESISWQQ